MRQRERWYLPGQLRRHNRQRRQFHSHTSDRESDARRNPGSAWYQRRTGRVSLTSPFIGLVTRPSRKSFISQALLVLAMHRSRRKLALHINRPSFPYRYLTSIDAEIVRPVPNRNQAPDQRKKRRSRQKK